MKSLDQFTKPADKRSSSVCVHWSCGLGRLPELAPRRLAVKEKRIETNEIYNQYMINQSINIYQHEYNISINEITGPVFETSRQQKFVCLRALVLWFG